MEIQAPAKINLFLRVVQRREDGFHEIETLFQAIGLADTLRFEPAPEGTFVLTCDDPSLPTDERNLVTRAAMALRQAAAREAPGPLRAGARVTLYKRIPTGGGLGGGSSDAAAALFGLCRLWELPLADDTLHELAAALGSDVSFFLRGGTAIATGRGEVLSSLPDAPPLALVLVTPPFGVATPEAYRAWRPVPETDLPSAADCADALARGDLQRLGVALRNDLEPGVFARYPVLATIRERLLAAGAVTARMTGSGSTLYALARDVVHARRIATAVADIPGQVMVITSLPPRYRTLPSLRSGGYQATLASTPGGQGG
jgi:4-diphosphocytidyl-2-C-methyl-D-erythritol kinase